MDTNNNYLATNIKLMIIFGTSNYWAINLQLAIVFLLLPCIVYTFTIELHAELTINEIISQPNINL